jgi:hypothetical protein
MTDTPGAPGAPPPPPASPAEAIARLDQLKSDPTWREGFLSGSGSQQFREYQNLTELAAKGDKVDLAMSGAPMPDTPFQDSDHVLLVNMANFFRELGMQEEIIKENLERREITPYARDWVANEKADRLANSEWRQKLFSGDREAKRWFTLAHEVLSRPVTGESGRF